VVEARLRGRGGKKTRRAASPIPNPFENERGNEALRAVRSLPAPPRSAASAR